MRSLPCIALIFLLAGCTTNAPTDLAAQSVPKTVPTVTPTHLSGTVWLPDQEQPPLRSEIAFPVNATGARMTAALHLGSRYVVELPTTTAEVTAMLVGPENVTLAKATMHSGAQDATLRAKSNATGTHKLVLLSYGGSDGSSMGDHVSYTIDAAVP